MQFKVRISGLDVDWLPLTCHAKRSTAMPKRALDAVTVFLPKQKRDVEPKRHKGLPVVLAFDLNRPASPQHDWWNKAQGDIQRQVRMRPETRLAQILELREQDMKVSEIAETLGISKRQVFQILS